MTIVYAVEEFSQMEAELRQVTPLHWKELALFQNEVPLEVDWERYNQLQDIGMLHCVTVRDEGKLIGYHIAIISLSHLHYKSLRTAITDVYYVLPEYRQGYTGVKLFQVVKSELRKLYAPIKWVSMTKLHFDKDGRQARMLERIIGMRPIETMHAVMIRG
jgi:L-amino acid N-acyltransferase YncA